MTDMVAFWNALTMRRKAILLLAVGGALAAVLALARIAGQPTMALLYAGLEPQVAGQVLTELERMNIPAKVEGDAVYVPSDSRDRVRLALAQQGLPEQGQAGYELLDGMSGFGSTAEMFDAAYWRAREGELARTILALPGVAKARVHIANPPHRAFGSRKVKPTASVTATMRGANALDKRQALSIRYMVALAVADLAPSRVVVIDARHGVILRPGDDAPAAAALSSANEREGRLRAELTDLLSARVGAGGVRVRVNLETNLDSETTNERIIDPESRIAIHTDAQESEEKSTDTSGGAVTVASNLPSGDAASRGNGGTSARTSSRERTNYDVSEVQRKSMHQAGAIKRIGVAVLLDGVTTIADDGTVNWAPRPKEELHAIETLVKSAIGFDKARGDSVTVETMRFSIPPNAGTVATSGMVERLVQQNMMMLIQLGVLALVALVLGVFVVRPLLTARPAGVAALPAPMLEGAVAPMQPGATGAPAMVGDAGTPALPAGASPEGGGDPMTQLREVVAQRTEESTALLKTWLDQRDDHEEVA